MGNHRRSLACVVVLAASVLLASCTAPAPDPTPAPDSTPVRSPDATTTPTADALGAPTVRLDVSCADLSTSAAVADATGGPSTDLDTTTILAATTPSAAAIRAAGGIDCAWGGGAGRYVRTSSTGDDGSEAASGGMTVSLAPVDRAQWEKYASYYAVDENTSEGPFGSDSWAVCPPDEDGSARVCTIAAYVNGTMIEGYLARDASAPVVTSDSFRTAAISLARPVYDAVAASAPPTAAWTPEPTTDLPSECAAIVGADELSAILATGSAVLVGPRGGGGWSLAAAASEETAEIDCGWTVSGSDIAYGGLVASRGGEWAWDAVSETRIAAGSAPLEVEGLAASDSAYERCTADGCTVDLVLGGNWIQYDVLDEPGDGIVIVDPSAAAGAIAAVIAANSAA